MTFRELLAREFSSHGDLSAEVLDACTRHFELMRQWNERMNLTRIESLEEVVRLHYCESLFLAKWLPPGPYRVVDIGSGPGFPGVPVGILRPDLDVTLVESHKRKAVFLRESTRGLPNIHVQAVRAQDLKDRFEWIISRAVAVPEVAALKIAPKKAILASRVDVPVGWEAIPLPWGENRVISVPRETIA